MNAMSRPERDQFHQLLGAGEERILQLERRLLTANEQWAREAQQWKLLQLQRTEIAEWLVDQATDPSGELVTSPINAGLQGEMFVPCTYTALVRGRRFQLSLVTTDYHVIEIDDSG